MKKILFLLLSIMVFGAALYSFFDSNKNVAIEKKQTLITQPETISQPSNSTQKKFSLNIPVDCTLGTNCFIQNYVDAKAGETYSDFLCRSLSYNGHKGTDFRVGTYNAADSVAVLAAADGVVARLRDGVEDLHLNNPNKADVSQKECGNAVVIKHKNNWETQYCHLQQGSLTVRQGQQVKAGDVLARIGLSGSTEFPHLHLSVRNAQQQDIDPFTGNVKETSCNPNAALEQSLWSANARSKLSLSETGYLASGFASSGVDAVGINEGKFNNVTLAKESPALVFWSLFYGLQKGDKLTMLVLDTDKRPMVQNTEIIKKSYAQYHHFIGKKRQGNGSWKAGTYEGLVSLIRGDKVLADNTIQVRVE